METSVLDQIQKCCVDFIAERPYLLNPDGVVGQCVRVSEEFCITYPDLRGEILSLCGYRTLKPRRYRFDIHKAFPDSFPDYDYCHTVILFPDKLTVDLTYRQLDTEGAPFIFFSMKQIIAEWMLYTVRYSDPIVQAMVFHTEARSNEPHLKTMQDAYHKTRYYRERGALHMTGTHHDNPYLDAFLSMGIDIDTERF
jgi:hypothetical protein